MLEYFRSALDHQVENLAINWQNKEVLANQQTSEDSTAATIAHPHPSQTIAYRQSDLK
jgi:hypothetical protein